MRRNGNKKRSLVATITTLSIVALLLVSLTVAFLTDSRSTLNILGIGNDGPKHPVQIALLETKFGALPNAQAIAAINGLAGEYAQVRLNDLMPGDKVNKDSTVKNVGTSDVYVRIRLTDENNKEIDPTAMPYDSLAFAVRDEWFYDSVTNYYYYYEPSTQEHKALAPQDSLPVFVAGLNNGEEYTIELSTAIDNDILQLLGSKIDIKVNVDAIQVANFVPSPIDGFVDPWNGEDILEVINRTDVN